MKRNRFRLSKKILGKKLEGEWILLHLERGEYYGLNDTASLIWDELKRGHSFEDAIIRLQEIFSVGRPEIEGDMNHFLKELLEEGLVEFENSSSKD